FDENGNAYLSDFGIAKDLTQDLQLTVEGAFIGTPDYTSPEQLRNEAVTPAADIYSLGAVLYETLTGERPFGDSSFAMRIQKQLQEPLPFVGASRPDLPAQIDDVVQKATAKNPADRYPDALSMAEAFRRAVRGDGATAIMPTAVPAGVEISNPYKGLRAFQENDAADFFGRESLVQQLVAHLAHSRFLAVVGPSGSGKSSLVKAGLIPALREEAIPGSDKWFVAEMVPGTHPLEELELALLPIAVDPPPSLVEPLGKDERGILRTIRRILPDEEDAQLLLVIDQFEELFTMVDDEERRRHFLESLVTAISSPRTPLHVVVTLRADFYDRPLQMQTMAELFKQHTEIVLPLTREELTWAIREPAQQMGVGMERDVVTAMVADVAEQPGALPLLQYALTELFDERQDNMMTLAAYEELGGVAGALAQRAEELYTGLDEAGQEQTRQLFLRLITLGAGVEDTRRRVPLSELEALQTSEVLETSEVSDVAEVLNQFGFFRLLTFDHDPVTREPTVEVAHEALLREWPRLRRWLEQSRDDVRLQRTLAAAAAEWARAGQDPGFLLRGSRLDLYESWAEDMDLALTGDEEAYLEASIHARQERGAAEEARRQQELETAQRLAATEKARAEEQEQAAGRLRQRAMFLTGALVIAALLAIAAVFFANQSRVSADKAAAEANQRATAQVIAEQQRAAAEEQSGIAMAEANARATAQANAEASESEAIAQRATAVAEAEFRATAEAQAVAERNTAEEQSRLATSRELAAAALNNIDVDPELSILLALQALESDHTFEAESALHTAIQNSAVRQTFYHGPDIGASFVTVNPNGEQFFVSGANGGTMWDLSSGEVQYTVEVAEGDWINDADFTSDGSMLILPGETWDGDTLLPSPLSIIDAVTGQELASFEANEGLVQGVGASPDGKLIVSVGDDEFARIWDLEATLTEGTGQLVHELCCLEGGARARFSPDSSLVAAVDNRIDVKVWDIATGELLYTLEADEPRDVHFSPDGSYIATASQGMVEIWDATTGERLSFALMHEESGIRSVRFTPDGAFLTATSTNRDSSLWQFVDGSLQPIKTFKGHRDRTFDSEITPDGRYLLTTSEGDGTARLWSLDPQDTVEIAAISSHEDIMTDVQFIGDGSQFATAANDGLLKVWDTTSLDEVKTIQAHEGWTNHLAVSPDGQTIATAGFDATVKLWNRNSGSLLHTLEGHEQTDHYFGGVVDVAFSPDGKLLGTAGTDALAMIWDVSTGERLLTLTGHSETLETYELGAIIGISFSPDGRFLATASNDATVRLWDSRTGEELLVLTGDPQDEYWSVAISPDGQRVVATRPDEKVDLWQLPAELWADGVVEARPINSFETTAGWTFSSAFSPDGTKIAFAGQRGIVEVRDAHSLEVQLSIELPTFANCVIFTPDGKGLVTCSDDGVTRFFMADYDELLELAHARLTRSFTEEECQRYLHLENCPG
ncbi:MAG: protein kinase, partial [Candidatus Promineifilaceae bacterium]|nr:protein kinase [Candidatus Promineifilaceae bacterium]